MAYLYTEEALLSPFNMLEVDDITIPDYPDTSEPVKGRVKQQGALFTKITSLIWQIWTSGWMYFNSKYHNISVGLVDPKIFSIAAHDHATIYFAEGVWEYFFALFQKGVKSIYSGGNKFVVFFRVVTTLQNTTNLFPPL